MLTVEQALAAVLEETQPLAPVSVELADALGLVSAEETIADIDSPPFDKALMDGFAVRSADLASGTRRLRILEEITAGMTPSKPVTAGSATRIMTGAPLPEGADAVVKIEDVEIEVDSGFVEVRALGASGTTHLEAGCFAQTRYAGVECRSSLATAGAGCFGRGRQAPVVDPAASHRCHSGNRRRAGFRRREARSGTNPELQ